MPAILILITFGLLFFLSYQLIGRIIKHLMNALSNRADHKIP